MATFRRLAWYFLDEAETLYQELLLDYYPSINLGSIQDDLTNLSRGFSFVQHPKNRLIDAYLELANRACIYRQHHLFYNGQWNRQSIYKYIDRDERLRKLLMGVLYTTGGQVPRIPELSSLEYVNGPSTERGFYVWNGSIIYLTRHHKAKRSTNREFFVTSSQFLRILNDATEQAWKQRVTTQHYRQLAIGITEKHVREIFKPFNRHDDRTMAADFNIVFAWQSSHRPVQRNHTYGLDGAFPNQLQPALLRAYEWASTRWHEFLGLASKHLQSECSVNNVPSAPLELYISSRVGKSSLGLLDGQTTEIPPVLTLSKDGRPENPP
ncbi:hypothetical protein EYB25_009398 [Talaromyces marneffei]|nr:hypothetical protein EYB25_009398 [Talaromyces marneffei]